MKVICKAYKTCFCSDECDHSIPHDIKKNSKELNDNCMLNLKERSGELMDCCCSVLFLRKEKLDKLNGI